MRLGAIAASTILLLGACEYSTHDDSLLLITGSTMGTTYSVKVHDPTGTVERDTLASEIARLLERVNDQMSTWRPDSELSRFNASTDRDWFPVSADVARVLEAARDVSGISGGAFDVTVGPVVNAWGFGPAGDAGAEPPTAAEIEAARTLVGYRRLQVRTDPPALRKQYPAMYVDLSAIAKGFAVDELARLLDARNLRAYLVELGGELRARGEKPDGSPWKVAIEKPVPGERAAQSVVALRDASIATSGDYRNFRRKDGHEDGRRYSHTIDPRTGRPVDHALASVSVIMDSAMRADAFATAIMVLGPEAGYRLAERNALAAQLIVRSGDEFEVLATPQFRRSLLR